MKTLEAHNAQVLDSLGASGTDIECPHCSYEVVDVNPDLMLLTSPPQYRIHCVHCGWEGTRF